MEFEEGIVDLLKTSAAVTALVGDRIFPLDIPEGIDRPAVSYELDGEDRIRETGGLVQAFLDLFIEVEGRDYGTSKAIANAIRERLDTVKGVQPSGFSFRGVTLEDSRMTYVRPTDGSGKGHTEQLMEFSIWYRESQLAC